MIDRQNLFTLEVKEFEPTGEIGPQEWVTAHNVQSIFDVLEGGGFEARFVGGCVRDAIAKRPVNDIDIATTAKPEHTIKLLESANIKVIPTGIKHGTVTAVLDGENFEITTLRKDVSTDGRHAEVAFTDDWMIDAERRDFTINALMATRTGAVYDPFNGIADLAYGRVCFIGKAKDRIEEDYLRILRYFRFHTSHGRPPVNRDALSACRMAADKLSTLSGERIQHEMMKILGAHNAADTLILMKGEHVLDQVLPEAENFGDLRALIWLCTSAINYENLTPDPVRNLATLLPINSDTAVADTIASRWRFSNIDRKRLIDLTGFISPDPMITKNELTRHLIKTGPALYADQCLITWARETAENANLSKDRKKSWIQTLERIYTWQEPFFPLTGEDLKALGYVQGPAIGDMMDKIKGWWIDNDCTPDRHKCLDKLKQLSQ